MMNDVILSLKSLSDWEIDKEIPNAEANTPRPKTKTYH
jgi:hypothetical protein